MAHVKLKGSRGLQDEVEGLSKIVQSLQSSVAAQSQATSEARVDVQRLLDEDVLTKLAADVRGEVSKISKAQADIAKANEKMLRDVRGEIASLESRLARLSELATLRDIRSMQSSVSRRIDQLDATMANMLEESTIRRKDLNATRQEFSQIVEQIADTNAEVLRRLRAVETKIGV